MSRAGGRVLPHGIVGEATEPGQPGLIAMGDETPNAGNVRFFVDRTVPQSAAGYERIVYLFSGHDPDAVTEARIAWKTLLPDNTLTYWQQDESGRWVKRG